MTNAHSILPKKFSLKKYIIILVHRFFFPINKICPLIPKLSSTRINKTTEITTRNKSRQKQTQLELPFDPAIPLLGTYTERIIIQKDTCTPMFTAALFTIAKTPKCPSVEEWIKKTWYIYIMEYC